LEARVALLDPEFIESYWKLPSSWRFPGYKGIEKYWLRAAFKKDQLLPEEVLWRKKEAFSDGISSVEKSWFTIVQEYIEERYKTTEKEYYKEKFIQFFGAKRLSIIPDYWQPKWDKNGNLVVKYVDPSARTLDVYYS
jgi:asparagine synthase (glutamine-hydrolysing)